MNKNPTIEPNLFIHILAARPNFIKAAPLIKEMISQNLPCKIVHTGQHYDKNMSDIFLTQLNIPTPNYFLEVGGGSHAEQVGKVMIKLEKILISENPKGIIVYGDVNATLAASLVASKIHIPIIHVESGCRSYDNTMPEEINRILVDRIANILFTTSEDALDNLTKEGVDPSKCFFVGNTMIDSLVEFQNKFSSSTILSNLDLKPKKYNLCTFHRPSNVDNKVVLEELMDSLVQIHQETLCVLPLHPRTKNNLKKYKLYDKYSNLLKFIPPQGYFDFMCLQQNAYTILTDSGGIQEESSYFNVPCLTLRTSTERPVTITNGTNKLIGVNHSNLKKEYQSINRNKISDLKLWDGGTSQRIVQILKNSVK
jgi:UDP-N-acetylglucosamine 2-epimerase (non-hydrolysing)